MNEPITTCDRCIFWQEIKAELGNCRRRSPAPLNAAFTTADLLNKSAKAYWPTTYSGEWCGEAVPRVEATPDDLEEQLLTFIRSTPGVIQRLIVERFASHSREALRQSLSRMHVNGSIEIRRTSHGNQHFPSARGHR
jgi:hypothetical protein